MTRFRVVCRDGSVVCWVTAVPKGFSGRKDELFETRGSSFDLDVTRYQTLFLQPLQDSVWRLRCDELDTLDPYIVLDHLPPPQPIDWYHRAMGFERIETDLTDRRHPVRVGVVDAELGPVEELDHVERVRQQTTPDNLRHAELILRLLANRRSDRRLGLVPWARVGHFAAVDARGTQRPELVAEGVLRLTDWGADIINLSLGWRVPRRPTERLIRTAIEYALDRGVTVVAAAGNRSSLKADDVPVPAAFDDVISVAGLGDFEADQRPAWSEAFQESDETRRCTWLQHPVLGNVRVACMRKSLFHASVTCVAPGAGIVVDCGAELSVEVIGTSFAAPLVTGWLADRVSTDRVFWELPRDRHRSARAFEVLKAGCVSLSDLNEQVGYGLPCLRGAESVA